MAERSFKKEVQQLRIPAGEEFRGEGILAVTKALLQSGVGYVAGYQGSPISHLMDVLADAKEILDELGVHFEASASEATAAATLAASVHYPIRGAVTWKSTVGTNVASDALANLASGGVTGGALIIIGEDYGEGSSIMQERSHAFAMKSQMWLLDPRPNLESIVKAVEDGFELSEASSTPVMLEMRIRSCHVHGRFITRENRRPAFSLADALANPRRDTGRIVLPPASFLHEHEKIRDRWPAAVKFIRERKLNEFFDGDFEDVGLILQGGLYNGVIRGLQLLGLADSFGNSRIPLYVMNVTYPVIDDQVLEFCDGKRAVLLLEEGQPDFIEQNLHAILRKAGVATKLAGKDVLPMAGEYTTQVMRDGIEAFLKANEPRALATGEHTADGRGHDQAACESAQKSAAVPITFHPNVQALASVVPPRPAGFCTGCPERPIFAAMKLAQADLGEHHISCDIGCHLFSILPPFNLGATTMGYGLGAASSSAFNVKHGKRSISVMGDGGFWHNGLTSGIGNAVFNKNDGVIVIVDNFYSSATGGQDILSSRADNPDRTTKNPIEKAIRGAGVKWVRTIDRTYDVARMRDTLEEALTTTADGPKVIIAQSECMLNKQRRVKPLFNKAVKAGERVVKERFGVDPDVCTGDHACIRLSGCPSLSVKDSGDPLKEDPVAHVDSSCVGCGNCGEVAEAAVLCPSFYRADIIHNPTFRDRFVARMRGAVIGWLQRRRAARLARFAL
ncbi:indolepyruvate ferredoxin oxidoreductase subunit alpha [Aromatoleum sp.]|uniref:indolepyruvate ferredoxin oxidoreductase subunit alpha n=1 Tax=Aromatoleum sp. TaxID=2307007 RepID=UPI002FC5BC39